MNHRHLNHPALQHLGLVTFAIGALLAVYALVNALSASIRAVVDAVDVMPVAALTSSDGHELPDYLRDTAATATDEERARYDWSAATVKRRDTLTRIFSRHGFAAADAYEISALPDASVLRKIQPGEKLELGARDGKLSALRYRRDIFTTLHVNRRGETFTAKIVKRIPQLRLRSERARIRQNLLSAADRAGIDFEVTYQFAKLFGWQVDFSRDLRRGDRFALVFEELFLDGIKVANGNILAAELILSGRPHPLRAIRHTYDNGRIAYYAPNGDSVERSFLRSPLEFVRVTSKFSHKRFHPVLKRWRAHNGVDYGAKSGTPALATADGVVIEARRKGGYGKTVVIRHGAQYTTLYAHLNGYARGIRSGARIEQGQVIGYVGATGWATGPHLHYEFRIDGVHRNPLTVKFPKSAPIDAGDRGTFIASAKNWTRKLARIGAQSVQLAEWQ